MPSPNISCVGAAVPARGKLNLLQRMPATAGKLCDGQPFKPRSHTRRGENQEEIRLSTSIAISSVSPIVFDG
jgi:hypothetical protein